MSEAGDCPSRRERRSLVRRRKPHTHDLGANLEGSAHRRRIASLERGLDAVLEVLNGETALPHSPMTRRSREGDGTSSPLLRLPNNEPLHESLARRNVVVEGSGKMRFRLLGPLELDDGGRTIDISRP